jgi:hypothetical protein
VSPKYIISAARNSKMYIVDNKWLSSNLKCNLWAGKMFPVEI